MYSEVRPILLMLPDLGVCPHTFRTMQLFQVFVRHEFAEQERQLMIGHKDSPFSTTFRCMLLLDTSGAVCKHGAGGGGGWDDADSQSTAAHPLLLEGGGGTFETWPLSTCLYGKMKISFLLHIFHARIGQDS